MLKRLRRLRIPLAAKCQLLFGLAVALIVVAALFVPWQRMEQLTEQLDHTAAGALVENALLLHAWTHRDAVIAADTPPPSSAPVDAGTATPSDTFSPVPRLISPATPREAPQLTRFERQALRHFQKEPDSPFYAKYYDRPDGSAGYRYAEPVKLSARCAGCHVGVPPPRLAAAAETAPTTSPPTTSGVAPSSPGSPPLIGIVTVDMASRIDANQLLLNRVFMLAAGLLAGSLAIVVLYWITTRLILQPVRVLQETAEKVSEGDLNIRSDINTGDEFQQLSETFNTMLANLKTGSEQLRAINKSLDLKLGQLAESNVALYESNRLKSEFLANVSHELRTPLNSILGFGDLLKDAIATATSSTIASADGKSARYVNNILFSARHLLELINDLLDLAKIEAGRMEIRSEPLTLPDLFEGLAGILKPLSEQKQLAIVTSVAPDVPILRTDPAKLQQILYNFLSNAIKFSPPASRVDVTAARDDFDHVRISVTDRGPGIDPDKHELIFEKFRQVDSSVTRTHGGTGLGLAIAKELTALLGGSIGVRSTPGEGATFWVVLPIKIQAGHTELRGRLMMT